MSRTSNAYRPLTLAIRSLAASNIMASSSAGLSAAQRSKVLARDDHTCVYCGFRSERFQEVRPLNPEGAARPGQTDDWVTSCHMCDQSLSLQRVGMLGEGILIWLPELTQGELNHVVRALYLARASDSEATEPARRGLEALKARRDEAKKRLGTDDPLILATVFADFLDENDLQNRADRLEGIRLLSLDRRLQRTSAGEVDRFPDMLAYWRSREGPFGNTPPKDWPNLLSKLPVG
jgi:intracellular multiplication protein IcmJ